VQVHRVGFRRHEEREQLRQSVFDRTEVRTVAPALANVERRLPEAALLGIDLA
jgi:hypothetical protein